ncbi:MAG TPA: uroporphyrinogen-III C-methyltransferase [Polyangiaceae bacterium LLY-WYZ-15_(1-7)]|nr:uroporphyrinogen-III C-methyltransferase [Polyangiaceae bacterium LLY-WYZ-15_(1-7)]HJL10859.1 uroporphyrinogen-III C-methyltransferase [Polyangiaceae bacterium LLY-WYZ-15_(1-7)]HJL35398.1 uroporphyrinogen-III C-methyltransferase [Polyangiaceae bacterium LLY-WYZ-15_(1-7)]
MGKVYLVGAGPGDPELITVKAQRRLAEADLVLYDALAHPELLDLCKPGAEKVFVGKRAGKPSERQARINARLVDEAKAGRTVVRLKGGDPFLFGRGSEEAEVLAEAGVPFEVVPGVPSPVAATAYAGLSLTHRNLASSVTYLTATESPTKDRSSHDWAKLATASQTLVVFMGMRKLDHLMGLLVEHGRDPSTPAAVVHWASMPQQRTVVGTIADIAEKAAAAELGLPSLIIVGEVVRLREHLRWWDVRPLFGTRVLVTRAPHQAGSLAELLRDRGAAPLLAPTIRVVPPADRGPLLQASRDVGAYDWVLFTSANAVLAFFEALAETEGDARRFGAACVCAIGKKTARALKRRGVVADRVPAESRAEGVLAELAPLLRPGARLLLPRAEVAREILPETLREAGHRVDVVPAYRTVPVEGEAKGRVASKLEEADAVTFTSSSTVTNLLALTGPDALAGKVLASIGPITSATLRDAGLTPTVEAQEASIEGLVQALEEHYAQERDR